MRQRNILQLGESDAVKLVSHVKHTFAHLIEREVWTELVFVKVELGFLGFFEIVRPVPRFGLKVFSFFLYLGTDVVQFFPSLVQRRSPYGIEQTVYIFRVLGHAVFKHIRRIILVSHELCLFEAFLHE